MESAADEKDFKRASKAAIMALVKQQRLDTTSINIYTRAVTSFLGWLHREGITQERIVISKVKELDSVIPMFTDAQVAKLIAHRPSLMAQRRVHVIACVILDVGARISEVINLHRRDVDYDSLLMKITGKGNKERVVPFTMDLRRILWRYTEDHQPPAGDLVFWQGHGRLLSDRNILDDFYTLCDNLGIQAPKNSFHPLRHTMATNYIRQGGDAVRLQRILGHSSITTTMKYVHLQTEDLQKVHEQFSVLPRVAR